SDSEQSAHYEEIVDKLRAADVTVSVVGLGTDHDCDANLLKDIARRGGGECYFSNDPDEIPRIFAQDTFTVARSTFIDQPTPFAFTAGFSLLGSALNSPPPALGGYNLCYIRPTANLAAVTGDEYKAPVVASWNAGNGRVLCYLGEADGHYSGELAQWNQAGEFYTTLARWVAGRRQPLPSDMLLTQEIREGICWVQLHLDPERKADPFSILPRVKILHGNPGVTPAKSTLALQWKNADLLEAAIPVAGRETVLNTVEIAGQSPVTLPPVCLPYSPEFVPEQAGRGAATLAQLATTTGGRERVEIPKIWEELPLKSRYVELAPWLLVLAAILFLVEILERRTGYLAKLVGGRLAARPASLAPESGAEAAETADEMIPSKSVTRPARKSPSTSVSAPSPAPLATAHSAPTAVAESEKPGESALDALRRARERAKNRTDK
ncbi:MAG TPA: hypothetical protein VF607_01760, partial [Verrucomicrobiae bacterium]